jgi:hypothetical protein
MDNYIFQKQSLRQIHSINLQRVKCIINVLKAIIKKCSPSSEIAAKYKKIHELFSHRQSLAPLIADINY